jgi:alkyldihydroxyacetonephosphate synthase
MDTTFPWIDELPGLLGADQISTDAEEIRLHSYDWWPVAAKWRQQGKQPYAPVAVVRPATTTDVSRLVQWAAERQIPLTPWGAGSAVTGAALPLHGGLSVDMSAMNRLLELDEHNLLVKVQAGLMGHHLEAALNQQGYTLNHSPQSLDRSTVGGWVATRATGQFSSRWGGIEEIVVGLTVVLPTGEVVETRLAPRAAIGPDLRQLFIGAEGTLGIVTDVTLRIAPLAECRIFEAVAFGSIEAGLQAIRQIMRAGLRPLIVRFYDKDEASHAMKDKTFSRSVLFLGFEGIQAVAQAEWQAGISFCEAQGGGRLGPEPVEAWMKRRFDFSTIEKVLEQPGGVAETIEVSHFWDGILATYYALKSALKPLANEALGHFSHVYPHGTSLYMILLGQAENSAAAEARLMQIWETSMQICLESGAAISHHHGIGLARLPYIRRDLGSAITVLERVKDALDPAGILNPGKLGLPSKQ